MKAIILDRDGVINHDSQEYIKSIEEFHFIPGSLEAIVRLTQAGYLVAIATNQSGISRGLYTEDELLSIHQHLLAEVKKQGGDVHAIRYCPHLPNSGCDCRKPAPGMLLTLAEMLGFSLNNVYFLGDRKTDIQAAYAAGCRPVLIPSPMTEQDCRSAYPEVPVYVSLSDFVDFLLKPSV